MGFNLKQHFTEWLMKDSPLPPYPLCDFEALQHEVRPGDVILVEGRSRVSEVIKGITKSTWSHAALYIGRIHDIDDIAMRKVVAHAAGEFKNERLLIEGMLGKGTIVTPLSFYKGDHMRICRPKGLSYEDTQAVLTYCISALGTPYPMRHILDLARFLLPWSLFPSRWASSLFRPYDDIDSEICSSLLARAFQNVKFPVLPYIQSAEEGEEQAVEIIPRNARLYAPSDFDYSPYFEIIKYPMFNISHRYRDLPWSDRGVISNDHYGLDNCDSDC